LKWLPDQVDKMTFAEYYAAVTGYVDAQKGSSPETEAPSRDEYLRVLMEEQAAGRA
jgi:hypothetical protein